MIIVRNLLTKECLSPLRYERAAVQDAIGNMNEQIGGIEAAQVFQKGMQGLTSLSGFIQIKIHIVRRFFCFESNHLEENINVRKP